MACRPRSYANFLPARSTTSIRSSERPILPRPASNFSAAGFWHGPLDIYHLPDAGGRVVVSAAALAQPGTFDPSIMDSQRFSGLNLFAVLPGPKPERETFDELVHAARQLAERLDGKLADQHGEELTPQRISRLRQALEQPATARASGSD